MTHWNERIKSEARPKESKTDNSDLLCCENCDGEGKVRANYTNEEDKYVFHKKECTDCNGTGVAT